MIHRKVDQVVLTNELISDNEERLKLNTMQLETPGGNHCCFIVNDVQNKRNWYIHLVILNTVYAHDKQKTIVY